MKLQKQHRPLERVQAKFRPMLIFIVTVLMLFLIGSSVIFLRIRQAIQSGATESATVLGYLYSKTFSNRDTITAELDHYRLLAEKLMVDKARFEEIEQENTELRSMIEYKSTLEYDTSTARILARAPEGYHTILIDKGEEEGLRVGLGVIGEHGSVIGAISNVNAHSSVVQLLSDPDTAIPASIMGVNGTNGVLQGLDGFLLYMDFIPQDVLIQEGDIVVTSGFDGKMPAGLSLGVVSKVEKNEAAPFQHAFVEPIANPQQTSITLVIDPVLVRYAE